MEGPPMSRAALVPSPGRLARGAVLLAALGLAAALGTARAAPGQTVAALRRACEAEAAAMADAGHRGHGDGGWCAGYLVGVADTLAAFGAGGHPAGLCDARYDGRTLVEAFVRWARASPREEASALPMLAGAVAALRARWPCGG